MSYISARGRVQTGNPGDAYRKSCGNHGDACGGLVAIAETIAPENRYSAWR